MKPLRNCVAVAAGAVLMTGSLSAQSAAAGATSAAGASAAESATVCQRFTGRVTEAAALHAADTEAFLTVLREEFVAGAADPVALRDGLNAGRWNQTFFYAGHGGFQDNLDDDRDKYARGGNHQPGHFVAMLTIAALYGPQVAGFASQAAGDFTPDQQDDLRLSRTAIELGTGLAATTLGPADVARQTGTFCRSQSEPGSARTRR